MGPRELFCAPLPSAHVSFGHCWKEQIAKSEPFIWAAVWYFGRVKQWKISIQTHIYSTIGRLLSSVKAAYWKSLPCCLSKSVQPPISYNFGESKVNLHVIGLPCFSISNLNYVPLDSFFSHKIYKIIVGIKYLHDDVTSSLHWQGFLLELHAG